jgi:ATP-dependent protease ClpP protease subunit
MFNLLSANAKRGSFKAEGNTLFLYDVICGSDDEAAFYGGVSPQAFAGAMKAMTGPVHLRINSPGGDVFGAVAMAQAMREYDGEVIAHIDGYAASAASVIAVAASKAIMAPGSFMMIHKAWTLGVGNSDDLLATASLLEKIDATLADTYAKKSGKEPKMFADLMAKETWFTPQEAIDAGLADEIAEQPTSAKALAAWDMSAFAAAPKPAEKIEAVEATVAPEPAAAENPADDIGRRQRIHAARLLLTTA